jgi:predicted transcriptional regulator
MNKFVSNVKEILILITENQKNIYANVKMVISRLEKKNVKVMKEIKNNFFFIDFKILLV